MPKADSPFETTTLRAVGSLKEQRFLERLHQKDPTVFKPDEAHARKVQLRFNQMGLKVRQLKEQLS